MTAGAAAPSPATLPLAWTPPTGVGAWMSLRAGGVSAAPFDSFNVGERVGDCPRAVAVNRARVESLLAARPVWLEQVHGSAVVRLSARDAAGAGPAPRADASWTDEPGVACVIQVADCLPLLLAGRDGRAVAAAHVGWRGLAAGVVEAALTALCRGASLAPAELVAWLGPSIGPRRFEVGADVRAALPDLQAHFSARPRADGPPRWLADLPSMVRARLAAAGVVDVAGGHWCTVEDSVRFFSFRRDGTTGRMAAAIWRRSC